MEPNQATQAAVSTAMADSWKVQTHMCGKILALVLLKSKIRECGIDA